MPGDTTTDSSKSSPSIDLLREAMQRVDSEILRLVARRLELAASIGRVKSARGIPIRDPAVEEQVLGRGKERARALGIPEAFAEDLLQRLVSFSVMTQTDLGTKKSDARAPHPLTIGVIGSAGGMGQWCMRHFAAAGHTVLPCDPLDPKGLPLEKLVRSSDVIILAVTLGHAREVAQKVLAMRPAGVFLDLCSVKGALAEDLRTAAASGLRVTSVHPMFGPDALAGRTVLIGDCGNPEATRVAREIFADVRCRLVDVPLAEHDALMATVLGLSHMTSLVFMRCVQESGQSLARLQECAGTSFAAQFAVSEGVTSDHPSLCHDIQHLNPHTGDMLRRMRGSIDLFEKAMGASEGFAELMKRPPP